MHQLCHAVLKETLEHRIPDGWMTHKRSGEDDRLGLVDSSVQQGGVGEHMAVVMQDGCRQIVLGVAAWNEEVHIWNVEPFLNFNVSMHHEWKIKLSFVDRDLFRFPAYQLLACNKPHVRASSSAGGELSASWFTGISWEFLCLIGNKLRVLFSARYIISYYSTLGG